MFTLAVIHDTAGEDSLNSHLFYEDKAEIPEREPSRKQAQQAESSDTTVPSSGLIAGKTDEPEQGTAKDAR